MKRSALTVTFVLAGLLLLAVVPSFAASTWTALGEPGGSITSVQVTRYSSTYDITMNLTSPATTGNFYSVYFSPSDDVFNLYEQNIDSTVRRKAVTSNLISYTLINGEYVFNDSIPVSGSVSGNKLSWTVNISDILLTDFWFGGEVIGNTQNGKTAVAATPIPGAVWLLGSGVLGLVGLRRRQTA